METLDIGEEPSLTLKKFVVYVVDNLSANFIIGEDIISIIARNYGIAISDRFHESITTRDFSESLVFGTKFKPEFWKKIPLVTDLEASRRIVINAISKPVQTRQNKFMEIASYQLQGQGVAITPEEIIIEPQTTKIVATEFRFDNGKKLYQHDLFSLEPVRLSSPQLRGGWSYP